MPGASFPRLCRLQCGKAFAFSGGVLFFLPRLRRRCYLPGRPIDLATISPRL
jgi:hypothetical protein